MCVFGCVCVGLALDRSSAIVALRCVLIASNFWIRRNASARICSVVFPDSDVGAGEQNGSSSSMTSSRSSSLPSSSTLVSESGELVDGVPVAILIALGLCVCVCVCVRRFSMAGILRRFLKFDVRGSMRNK